MHPLALGPQPGQGNEGDRRRELAAKPTEVGDRIQ
jgi:hypothetical protein